VGFFDGASQRGMCGCGFWIKFLEEQEYWVYWSANRGTNMKAKAMALWAYFGSRISWTYLPCIFLGIPGSL